MSTPINGPAPMILAMFMNTAVDQQVEAWLRANGGWVEADEDAKLFAGLERPRYRGEYRRATTGPASACSA